MPECPICLGVGSQDERDMDAMFQEQFTTRELERMGHVNLGIRQCDECEGTGIVSGSRLRDLMAVARAHMDQALAKYATAMEVT